MSAEKNSASQKLISGKTEVCRHAEVNFLIHPFVCLPKCVIVPVYSESPTVTVAAAKIKKHRDKICHKTQIQHLPCTSFHGFHQTRKAKHSHKKHVSARQSHRKNLIRPEKIKQRQPENGKIPHILIPPDLLTTFFIVAN